MPSTTTLLLITVCFLVLIPSVSAFGAGEIPDYAYLNGSSPASLLTPLHTLPSPFPSPKFHHSPKPVISLLSMALDRLEDRMTDHHVQIKRSDISISRTSWRISSGGAVRAPVEVVACSVQPLDIWRLAGARKSLQRLTFIVYTL
jgi:hypothetical protein